MTNKKAAPVEEQPSNQLPNDTAEQTVEQEALEAIRKGLGMSGVEHDDWDFVADKVLASLKEAGLLKPDLEDIIRTVEPEARTRRFMSVYYPWPHRRTLAEAQRVAAAIVFKYGGSVETIRFSLSPKEGCIKVTACDTEISIYFEDKEASQ